MLTNEKFISKVLTIAVIYDCYDELFWSFDGESPFYKPSGQTYERALSPSVNCGDTFDYATADCEPITVWNVDEWESALRDAQKAGEKFCGGILFVARQRKIQPLPEVLARRKTDEMRKLFAECTKTAVSES